MPLPRSRLRRRKHLALRPLLRPLLPLILLLPALASSGEAEAQQNAHPTGVFTPGHLLRSTTGAGSPYMDAGGATPGSDTNFRGPTELGITNTGTPFCINDAPTSQPFRQLCLGANVNGSGVISYNSYGGASQLPLFLSINGTSYQVPFVGQGSGNVVGPNTSAPNQLAAFNATNGTALSTFTNPFYVNANGLAAGFGFGPRTPEHTVEILNTYTGGGSGGNATALFGTTDYKYVPGGTNPDNPAGGYGQVILSAAQTYNGVPAGVKGNAYTAPALSAAISAAGTGYTNGDVVTTVGGVCGLGGDLNTHPQFTLTVAGGTVTAAKFISTGTGGCSTYPSNPVSVTGGTGSGLTLNLTNSPINSTFLTGVYGRCRNVAVGTITYCASVFADGGYNTGGGNVTSQINFFAQPPYDTNYGAAYVMLMAAAGCSPNCWPNGTLLAAGDPLVFTTQTAGQGILVNSSGFLTLQTPTGGFNILLKPVGTSVTQIVANGGTLPLSGSGATAGLYPYMLSTGAAYIDALVLGAGSSTLDLRTYAGSGVYSDAVHINPAGVLFFNATPTVGTGTSKHLLCIDAGTHQVYEGTGATCS